MFKMFYLNYITYQWLSSELKFTILILMIFTATACDDMEDKPSDTISTFGKGRFYVLSEGLFNMNNGSLALYDFNSGEFDKNFFQRINFRGLGDTPNDIGIYGSKMYIVVSGSSQIEVVHANTGISLKRIPMFNEDGVARQPRHITFDGSKAYVCSFDGTVTRIDTASLQIESAIVAGRNPDGICVSNGKIYVSNSGGLSFPNYDNTVSVIDIAHFKEFKRISVAPNPSFIHADSEGDVYVVSRGDYGANGYLFQRIDTQSDSVVAVFEELNVLNFTIHKDTAYMYSFDFNSGTSWVKVFDCLTETIINEEFISDGTNLQTPYGIDVDPLTGNVYLTDARSYVMWGDVLCFDRNGILLFRLSQAGLNPKKVVFPQ